MKYNNTKIMKLAESYINGNVGYVRGKVKGLNKLEFCLLVNEIHNLSSNTDIDEIAFRLTGN
jgi:hypothetical protein